MAGLNIFTNPVYPSIQHTPPKVEKHPSHTQRRGEQMAKLAVLFPRSCFSLLALDITTTFYAINVTRLAIELNQRWFFRMFCCLGLRKKFPCMLLCH
jgi:hypothetical protein